MWFVYILRCKDNSLYTGITTHLERRFLEHKNLKGGHYTSSHPVINRVYSEHYQTKSEALKRERQIKGLSKIQKEELISNVGVSRSLHRRRSKV